MQNAVDVAGYSRNIEAGRFATVKGYAFTPEDKRRAAVIERLMCDLAIDLDKIPGDYSAEIAALQPLAENGVVAIDGRRLSITARGRPLPASRCRCLRRLSANRSGAPFRRRLELTR